MLYLSVALVGRPNVGKSTLLNGIVGKTVALVENTPGITRDGKTHRVRQGGMICDITDTAGYGGQNTLALDQAIWQHTWEKLRTVDLLMVVVDGYAGLNPQDAEVVHMLRRLHKPWVLVVNKSDRGDNAQDFFSLGASDTVVVSALHRQGLGDLWRVWKSYARSTSLVEDIPPRIITLWGRPNVGKSSIINMLTQSQSVLAGETSGLTRDSVGVPWFHRGTHWKFMDTAGLQRKKWVHTDLEHRMHAEAFRSLVFSQVAVLVLEPFSSLFRQDALLGSKILHEGRALVVMVNKWDQCDNKKTVKADIQHHLSRTLSLVPKVPIVFGSALKNQGRTALIQAIEHAYTQWTRRISTPELNRWWKQAMVHHTLQGKIKYMTQTQNRPPTFTFFGGGNTLSLAQKRHLTHKLQQDFSLEDTVIRCYFKA